MVQIHSQIHAQIHAQIYTHTEHNNNNIALHNYNDNIAFIIIIIQHCIILIIRIDNKNMDNNDNTDNNNMDNNTNDNDIIQYIISMDTYTYLCN